ncbi:hypothetical protein M501DRAFT_1002554 [Patellaria atrata CBS 101060]|uniref:U4/U6 snRNA-associated-splicing factor PRP24 n=1 Tax=Patellaria atrata CBS 101060 TaxID=1346257 RepID=A0A9P4VSA1_9PEZI|nr:hypothetical protein M501DRAFT_1002554 [Patellaria atrata CBS 101060]
MDIRALLSPEDSPVSRDVSPAASPHKQASPVKRPGRPAKRKSSSLSQQITSSPQPQEQLYNAAYQAQHSNLPSPGLSSIVQNGIHYQSAHTTPTSEPRNPYVESRATPPHPALHRQGSTPGMDTLADLASMQHHQATRQASESTRPSISYALGNLPRSLSSRSGKDLTMDTPPEPPRVYAAASLSAEDLKTITDLSKHVSENPYDFTSHVRFVNLLHKGFVNSADGHAYELLEDLRQARRVMDSRFPVGEELWIDWINDEKSLARNVDDRVAVMELCSKAVLEEHNSAALWLLYGEYMYHLWACAHDPENATEKWSKEDKEIGREVFRWEPMITIWDQAVNTTQWRLNDSNIVWDRYIEIMRMDQERTSSHEKVNNLRSLFISRLTKPHSTWENTFQMFSGFVTRYVNTKDYERTMAETTQKASQAKKQYTIRESYELKISQAVRNGDRDAEWYAYSEYLGWELRTEGVFSVHLINALFERATVRFPSDANLWEDYVEFLVQRPQSQLPPLLSVLDRATRHCPWSGDLWSHLLLALEAEGKDFGQMEDVKHRATKTGLLDAAGMDELLKVYITWCGYLRRRAFEPHAGEDEQDIAEVGIRSALEHVKEIGEKRYGKDYKGDRLYRLERIHIKLFTQSGNVEAARALWRQLVPQQGDSYDFWYRYYIWEMAIWSKFVMRDHRTPQDLPIPRLATDVLSEALSRTQTVDWPEQIIPMYLSHCEQHENVQQVQRAIIDARKRTNEVRARRQREAEAAAVQTQQGDFSASQPMDVDANTSTKRKRDDDSTEATSKKVKPEESVDGVLPTETEMKRDRENTTVTVKNLPPGITETKLRKFFGECGMVNFISIIEDKGEHSAAVEFNAKEEAEFALSRDGREIDGHQISVSWAVKSTLWITNFPPEADEDYLRNLFKPYGEIVEIRFPSLQFNTHRRFCYAQFLKAEQAEAALELDGKVLDPKHKLIVKISDPGKKTERHGPAYEGREIFVGNISWKSKEEDVRELFTPFGTVERVRMPTTLKGLNKGVAFLTMATKEDAEQAIKSFDSREVQLSGRVLNIKPSEAATGAKRTATTILNSASPEPSANGRRGSMSKESRASTPDAHHYKERTLALLDVPDTVNDARIRALVEPYGPLVKVILRPDHQGALVEFQNVNDMGKACLGIEGIEIAPGRMIRVGTAEEMMKLQPERKWDKFSKRPKPEKQAKSLGSGIVERPAQPGARRGGRGGLGFRSGGVGLGGTRTGDGNKEVGGEKAETDAAKSNADFRAMLLGDDGDGKKAE